MNVQKALDNATRLRAGERIAPPMAQMPTRRFAIGDPQTSSERLFGALAAHGLLGEDGWLLPDVQLVAMGDYFDYAVAEREASRIEGVLILSWLAAHEPDHVTILFGNHDAVRVMEFATLTDQRFRDAAAAASAIIALPRADRAPATAAFAQAFPDIPTPGYVARDFNAFTVEQRELVQRLLLAHRFSLAATVKVAGTTALATHAGITQRELEYLRARDHEPETIAAALTSRLDGAVHVVAESWRAGRPGALSLAPLHVPGGAGEEGGGLLYHRPADPGRPDADASWEARMSAPRRYDPRVALPRGLPQVVGHTGHSKACQDMPNWRAADTDLERGGLRTLVIARDGQAIYRRGIHPATPDETVMYMIDPEMHYVAGPAGVAILPLD